MKRTPTRRLLGFAALWTAAALAVVWLPVLLPALLAGAASLAGVTLLDAWLAARRAPLELERCLPERAFVGRAERVELHVANPNTTPGAIAFSLHEAAPPDLQAAQQVFSGLEAEAGGQPLRVAYRIDPLRRGDRPWGAALALVHSPLGLWQDVVPFGAEQVLPVYPDSRVWLGTAALDPPAVLRQLGLRSVRRRGEGMEFESLREYVPGDDPRRLDWAASARRGRPVVRRYQHEQNHLLVIALDTSRLMAGRVGSRTKLDYAVDAALALTFAALAAGDRVAMALFDARVHGYLAPQRNRRGLGRFVEFLRCEEPRLVEASYTDLVRGLGARQRQHALVVVLSDFVEVGPEAMVQPLLVLGRRHRVLFAALRDPVYAELDATSDGAVADYPRRIALDDLLREREIALASLRRAGLHTVDLPPAELTAPILNRYLALRYAEA